MFISQGQCSHQPCWANNQFAPMGAHAANPEGQPAGQKAAMPSILCLQACSDMPVGVSRVHEGAARKPERAGTCCKRPQQLHARRARQAARRRQPGGTAVLLSCLLCMQACSAMPGGVSRVHEGAACKPERAGTACKRGSHGGATAPPAAATAARQPAPRGPFICVSAVSPGCPGTLRACP